MMVYQTRRQVNKEQYKIELVTTINQYKGSKNQHWVSIFHRKDRSWFYMGSDYFEFYEKEKARERYDFIISNFSVYLMERVL